MPAAPRGYCNEVVFRSAQKLAQSRAQARSGPKKKPLGKTVLISGAIALFGVGLLAGRLWPDRRTEEPPSSPRLAHETASPESQDATANSFGSRSSSVFPAAKSGSPESPAAPARHAIFPRAEATVTSPSTSPFAGAADDGSRPSAGVSGSMPSGVGASSSFTALPEFTLRGTLQSADGAAVEVEFVLRRRNESVSGVIRYLAAGERVAANAVSGRILGGTVELRETSFIWMRGPRSAPLLVDIGPEAALATFVFELPAETQTGPLTGDWSRGQSTGTLRIVPSPPW